MRVEMFAIADRCYEPKSFLTVDGNWDVLGTKTRFFSKKSRAYEAMQSIDITTKTMDVETVSITVE